MGNEGEGVGRLYGMDEVGMGTGPAGLKSKKKREVWTPWMMDVWMEGLQEQF